LRIIKNHQKLFLKYYSTEKYFEEYLSFCLPFSLDDPSFVLVKQIIDKIIKKDLFYYENLNQEDIQGLENTANFIANSPIGEINYSILSKNIGITKYKAKQYVDYLEKSFILKSIFPYSSNVIKEPKIILTLPFRKALNFRLANDQLKGALKEEFFVQALKNNNKLYYLKSNRGKKTPDYLLLYQGKKYIFEIGGPKKGYSQFKGVSNDYEKYLITYPGISQKNKIPLILFGFLD
jgi:Predicted ATPase (AAA+ superfamily)